ncbi:MAG: response regulator [Methylococcales bacterium]|nr:response regulator [Methylococcales bacterium]
MCTQIALVEDNDVIRENYSEIFIDEGYDVVAFSNQHDAINHFKTQLPDIAILDIGLNEERDAGYQLCSALRHLSQTVPIIFLTSRNEEYDRISGLRVGADDYITKDIGINYLIVRIEALFNRIHAITQTNNGENKISENKQAYGSLEFDALRMVAYWKGKLLSLTLTQYWILNELASHAGEIKDYSKLMRVANICVEPNTISAHIKTIRSSFRSEDEYFNCIKTERGAGYRWVEV